MKVGFEGVYISRTCFPDELKQSQCVLLRVLVSLLAVDYFEISEGLFSALVFDYCISRVIFHSLVTFWQSSVVCFS